MIKDGLSCRADSRRASALRGKSTLTPNCSAVPRIFDAKKRSTTTAITVLVMLARNLPPLANARARQKPDREGGHLARYLPLLTRGLLKHHSAVTDVSPDMDFAARPNQGIEIGNQTAPHPEAGKRSTLILAS